MPYVRRYKRSYNRSRSRSGYARRSRSIVPRLSYRDKTMIAKQNAGMDVKCTKFRFSSVYDYPFNNTPGTSLSILSYQPLATVIGDAMYTTYISHEYNEFRLVKATYSFKLTLSDCRTLTNQEVQASGALASLNSIPIFNSGWFRQSKYGAVPPITTYIDVNRLSGSKIKPIVSGQAFEMTTSIISDSSANEFLKTTDTPGVYPNCEFFCPCLTTGIALPVAATDGSIKMFVTLDCVIECRGTKLNSANY